MWAQCERGPQLPWAGHLRYLPRVDHQRAGKCLADDSVGKGQFQVQSRRGSAYIGHENDMRLACRVQVMGDMDVQTCPEFNIFGDNFFS